MKNLLKQILAISIVLFVIWLVLSCAWVPLFFDKYDFVNGTRPIYAPPRKDLVERYEEWFKRHGWDGTLR